MVLFSETDFTSGILCLDVRIGPLWLSSFPLPHTKEFAHTLIELRFNLKPLKNYLGWVQEKYVG